jgi:DedD protein
MEVRVRERLVGALVLVTIVVLLVPAILKGRAPEPAATPETAPVRRIEMPIGEQAPAAEEQVLVPEQLIPEPPPASSSGEARAVEREPDFPAATPVPPPAATPAPRDVAAPPAARTPAPPEASAAKSPATSAWAVQLGAFSNKGKAEQLVAELRKRRFAAFVLEYRASGQVLYRVRVGPEQDRARAEATAARLAKEGFQPVVARHP